MNTLRRWVWLVCLGVALAPGLAHAQTPSPTTAPIASVGSLTGEGQLYPAPHAAAPTRRVAASTVIVGVIARTSDGWLWAVLPDDLGWLPPDAPLRLTAGLDSVPLAPGGEAASAAPRAPPTAPAPASAAPTEAPIPPADPALTSAVPWLAPALVVGGLLALAAAALGWNNARLRRRLAAEAEQRQTSEAQLQELTLYPGDAILLTDLSGLILDATDPASQMAGQTPLAGLHLRDLFNADLGPLIEEALVMGRAQRDGVGLLTDPARLVSLEARVVTRQGRQVARLQLRDATRAGAEDALSRRRDLALYDIAITISRSLDRDKVLGTALDRLMRLASAEAGAIFLHNGHTRLWAVQGLSVAFTRQVEGIADDTGLMRQVLHSATPWLLPHLPVTPDALTQALAAEGVASLAVIPLMAHGEDTGIVLLGSRRPQAFAPRDVPLFEVIGAHIGVAVENARLFREVGENLRSLEQVRRFSESVFQNMSNGVITLDAAGRVTSMNHAAEQMLQTPLADAVEQPLAAVLDAPASLVDMLQHVQRLGTTFTGHELIVQRANAPAIPLRLSLAPLRDDKSLIIGAVLVFDDLTEQRAMEEERQRLDRLALLGEMTAVIAHELRNPLASISSGVQFLVQQAQPGEPSYEALALILRESTRLNQLLEDILEVSRTPRIQLTAHAVTEILDDVLSRWAQTAAVHRVRIVKDYAPDTPAVPCDPLRIEQAFSNLVMNAIQAMTEGGVLSVRTRVETLAGGRNGSATMLVVEIGDTGTGIPATVLPKLFTPFFTTKGKGTGLGLTITQRIINEHGGEVTVASSEGQGATFTVRLPIAR